MGEFPLALPESGPTVQYGWWDFVPGASPHFVNRATGAAIRYVGELEAARVPDGEGEWRLFEYSDRDFSYPLVVQFKPKDKAVIHPKCVNLARSTSFDASFTIDYNVSYAVLNNHAKSIASNFGGYVRVDDACRSVFTVWPIEFPDEKIFNGGIGLRIYGGWVAGEWHNDVHWLRKRFSVTRDGRPDGISGGFQLPEPPEHPELATLSMVSQRWFERSSPMENTPSDIREFILENRFDCSGFMQLTPSLKGVDDFYRLSDSPNFLQSGDGQAVVVLGSPKDAKKYTKYAEFPIFPCYLLFEGVAYGFTLTGDFRIGWEGPITAMDPRPLGRSIPEDWQRAYMFNPVTANRYYRSYGSNGRVISPKFWFWPIMQRMLTDAIWGASARFFQNVCGYESKKTGDFMEPKIQSGNEYKRAHCEDDWVCGRYRTDLFYIFEKLNLNRQASA